MSDDRPLFLSHPRMVRARAGMDALMIWPTRITAAPIAQGSHWPGTLAGIGAIAIGGVGWIAFMAWIGSIT